MPLFPFSKLPPYDRGKVRLVDHVSRHLAGNPWDDPVHRDLVVYTPTAYRDDPDRHLPCVLLLPGFAGNGTTALNSGLTKLDLATRLDRMFAEGRAEPFIAVLPDGFSSLGGSQYVDSHGIGSYASWLLEEILPFVDQRFRTTGRWGVAGTSSGGFGALHLALKAPGRFEALASHAGDLNLELTYLGEVPRGLGPVRAAGGPMAFVRGLWEGGKLEGKAFSALNLLAMSAAYAPAPFTAEDGFPARLPVDWRTGAVDFEVIRSWRPFDPLVAVEEGDGAERLAESGLLWIDAGDGDEYHLQLGAARLHEALAARGVPHVHEEWSGGHRSLSHRYEQSLPAISRALRT